MEMPLQLKGIAAITEDENNEVAEDEEAGVAPRRHGERRDGSKESQASLATGGHPINHLSSSHSLV